MAVGLYSHDSRVSIDEDFTFFDRFPPGAGVKFGLAQVYAQDKQLINSSAKTNGYFESRGAPRILDSKLYDIPNTVREAAFGITLQGVTGFTIAAEAGLESIVAIVEGRDRAYASMHPGKRSPEKPIIFGVLKLSSQKGEESEDEESAWHKANRDLVLLLKKGGADGVVCSSKYTLRLVKRIWPEAKTLVTSVRADWEEWILNDDQRFTISPTEAKEFGADYVVAGRLVSQAPDRLQAFLRFLTEIGHPIP